jgi:hypothetical protein
MKRRVAGIAAGAAIAAVALSFGIAVRPETSAASPGTPVAQAGTVTAVVTPLSQAEKAGLVHMREEEKLARDVYRVLGAQYSLRVFGNIAGSESTHMAAVKRLLDRYGVADPVSPDIAGSFKNQDLQGLYDDLIAQGDDSLTAALRAGIAIEKLDISDLKAHLAETRHSDIRIVYTNLLRGSQNHLTAFETLLARYGG